MAPEVENEKDKKEFSIIIPVYRELANINPCLERLSRLREISRAEVIVVDGDGGSTIRRIETPPSSIDLVTLTSDKGRGLQLNRGARCARGDALIFLHADTALPRRALPLVREALRSRRAGAFTLYVSTGNYLLKAIGLVSNIRSRFNRVPYGDQAFFIRRGTFEQIGGFENIPLMEDVALMQKLKQRRIGIRILGQHIRTSDRRWKREGILRSTLRNWRIYLAYRHGASPWELLRHYPPRSDAADTRTVLRTPAGQRRLIIFLKAPVPGRIKTRLASRIGDNRALEAYLAMVRDLLTNLEGLEEISLYYLNGIENTALLFGAGLSKVPEESAGKIRQQAGRDLGARMANAFTAAFREGRERVLLIGSDIPHLYTDLIDEFFQRLEEYPLVIGPAADGGYYLIGLRIDSFQPAVFEGIDWSTNRVYSQTLRRAEAAGLSVFSGKTLRDIDTLSDLDSLLRDKKTRERLPGLAGLFDT